MLTEPKSELERIASLLKSKRAKENLLNVDNACRQILLQNGGKGELSFTSVGCHLERGGTPPSKNTLRSTAGRHFRELINAWRSCNSSAKLATSGYRSVKLGDRFDELLAHVPDMCIRSEIGFLLAEGRQARHELDVLKARTTVTIDMRPIDARPRENGTGLTPTSHLPILRILEEERVALEHAIDEKHLRLFGISIGPGGECRTQGGRVLFSAGFISAIKKVLALAVVG